MAQNLLYSHQFVRNSSKFLCNIAYVFKSSVINRPLIMCASKAHCGMSVNRLSTCGWCHGTQNSGLSKLLSNRFTNTRLHFSNKIHQKRIVKRKKPAHYEDPLNIQVELDTLLYYFYNDRHYKYVSAFALTGSIFFLLMSNTIYKLPYLHSDEAEGGIYGRLNLNEETNRLFLAYSCVLAAAGVCVLTTLYLRRSVREMWLLRGGDSVRVITRAHFGKTRPLEVPLEHIQPLHGRGKRNIHLKIKSYRVKYYLDKDGIFPNPALYDFSAGLGRKIS